MNGNLKAAITSLKLAKWRSLITMLGIIIGIVSVVTIVSLGEGLKHRVSSQINQLDSGVITVRSGNLVNRGSDGKINGYNLLAFLSSSTLTQQDVDAISKSKSVAAAVPLSFISTSASSDGTKSNNLSVLGTTPQMAGLLRQKIDYGKFFADDDPKDSNFAVIGAGAARKLLGPTNAIGQTVSVGGQNFIVHGVLAKSGGGLPTVADADFDSSILVPMAAANELTKNHANIIQILIKPKQPSSIDTTVNETNKVLIQTHGGRKDFTVLKQYELINISTKALNSITGFMTGIAAISLLVAGIGIMGIMLVSVSERTREIGIRKAIGATNRQIRQQFLLEGLVLSIGGGVIGVVSSLAINLLLNLYTNLQPTISPVAMFVALYISISLGIIFSITPALKAARKHPIDALRGE